MKVAVWDTYVPSKNGDVLHFDIIVPEKTPASLVYQYGKDYLNSIELSADTILNTAECQLCHVEEPTEEMLTDIGKQGYNILPLGEIPANLPANPTRSDYILHLRAHFSDYRFTVFNNKSNEEVEQIYHRLYNK